MREELPEIYVHEDLKLFLGKFIPFGCRIGHGEDFKMELAKLKPKLDGAKNFTLKEPLVKYAIGSELYILDKHSHILGSMVADRFTFVIIDPKNKTIYSI